MKELLEAAEAWIADDPDPDTQAELKDLISRVQADEPGAQDDLADRFRGPLTFGTAGLRGVIGAGETRMNLAVVRRTTWGLARYLNDRNPDAKQQGVVIGYDGRRMSREFAEETAAVFAAQGIPAYLSPKPCPTPVAAFATTFLRAAASVMVTASHNPPEYNGYKVYWDNGAQIIPPHDRGIAAAIASAPAASAVPRKEAATARTEKLLVDFPEELEQAYIAGLVENRPEGSGDRTLPIVYTPLHGVGRELVELVLSKMGFPNVYTVAEQAEPDGAFPTVAFPNPEEPGALDLAYALADKQGADLILANDPDVDRLAVAVRTDAGWEQLTGNRIGVLLGHYVLTENVKDKADRLVIASCVSSPMLGAIARKLSVRYEETLTGFKWIANRAMNLAERDGNIFVFGYEEALGYTIGTLVRDKDGIGAALVFAELAATLKAKGQTVLDRWDELIRTYGLYASRQVSITLKGADGIERMQSIMETLRDEPPEQVGTSIVEAASDLKGGTRSPRIGPVETLAFPSSDVLILELEGGHRIIARPSGTEPKIKFYFDVVEELGAGEKTSDAQARAEQRMDELANAFRTIAGV